MYSFFAYIDRMKYINRWSLMRSTERENLMEHSAQVAIIAHALAVIGNTYFGKNYDEKSVAALALFHDTGEVITGDLPTPVKYYNPEIRDAYKAVEEVATDKLLGMLPKEMRLSYEAMLRPDKDSPESRLVKYADKLTAYIKCVEELAAGNSEFKKASKSIEKELRGYKSGSVEYFLDTFVNSFALTLDDLSK